MHEGKKSVSSWKEKNVTLKEKHLHAKKKQALFQLCFTKFSQKNILIKCDSVSVVSFTVPLYG
jgi:hypothetical protein